MPHPAGRAGGVRSEGGPASECLLETLFDNSPFPTQVFDRHGFSWRMNEAQRRYLGLRDRSSGIGTFNILTDPRVTDTARDRVRRAYAGEVVEVEEATHDFGPWRADDADTDATIYALTVFPLRDDAGGVIGIVSSMRDVTGRRRTERALRDSEELYRSVVGALSEGVVEQLADGTIRAVNPSAERILGLSAGTLNAHTWTDARWGKVLEDGTPMPFDEQPTVRALRSGKPVSGVTMGIRTPDGEARWLSVCSTPLFDQGATEAHAVVSSFSDITERKLADDALRESEARYRETFDSLQDLYFEVDANGRFTRVSPSCERHTGYTQEELIGFQSQLLYVDPADFLELTRLAMKHTSVNDFEALMRRRDGAHVWFSITTRVRRGSGGAIVGAEGTLRDINARKQAEDERDRLFLLSVDMLAVLDSQARFVRANPAWARTTGHRPLDLLGQRPFDFFHPDDAETARKTRLRLRSGEITNDTRLRMLCRDGKYRWLSWNISPPSDDGLTFCVVRDVHDQVQREEEQQQMVVALESTAAVLSEQAMELDRLRMEAEWLANCDVLTGVMNRRAWFAAASEGVHSAVAVFDIDFFKRVNDTWGHPAGDLVLTEVARRMCAVGDGGHLGRLGGEEFGVLFEAPFHEARATCEALLAAVAANPIELPDGTPLSVTVSGGLAPWRTAAGTAGLERVYEEADRALYQAKMGGRARLALAPVSRAA
ncbi:MAG: PAS domain S-box protein [Chloroflexi bacterium]|nr:PAS domain S-box protein [Chloroflexota bacterium]